MKNAQAVASPVSIKKNIFCRCRSREQFWHKVSLIQVPWAEQGLGFTMLFEVLWIDWLKEAFLSSSIPDRLMYSIAPGSWLYQALGNRAWATVKRPLATRTLLRQVTRVRWTKVHRTYLKIASCTPIPRCNPAAVLIYSYKLRSPQALRLVSTHLL